MFGWCSLYVGGVDDESNRSSVLGQCCWMTSKSDDLVVQQVKPLLSKFYPIIVDVYSVRFYSKHP